MNGPEYASKLAILVISCLVVVMIIAILNTMSNRGQPKGNLVNWDDAEWSLENMDAEDWSLDTVCILPEPRDVVFPGTKTVPDTKLLCNKLGGKMTVVKDQVHQNELITYFNNHMGGQNSWGNQNDMSTI